MLIGISKIPKIPMGNPQIPILLLNGHTNSSIWSKKTPNWNYEISAYIRIPSISAPNKKNSTYPSQAGAIGIILIMRIINSFQLPAKIQPFGIICKVYWLNSQIVLYQFLRDKRQKSDDMDYEKGEKNKDLTFISLLNHKQRVFVHFYLFCQK